MSPATLPLGLPHVLALHAADPDAVAIIAPGPAEERLTYAELWRRSGLAAARLRAEGVRAGERVALGMASRVETVVAVVAIQRLGCTLVPLQDVPTLAAGDGRQAIVLAALRASRAAWCLVAAPGVESYAAAAVESHLPTRVLALETVTAEEMEAGEWGEAFHDAPQTDDDLLIIQFSSGSTAQPKGVCLTRGAVNAHVAAIAERLRRRDGDVTVSWLPLFHDMGLIGALLTTLAAGTTLVLMRPQDFVRNPLGWIDVLSRYRATVTMAPQFAYSLCLARAQGANAWARLADADLSQLRVALNGSETVHQELSDRFTERFAALGLRPDVLQPAYGLAENCVAVTMRDPLTPVPVRRLSRAALAHGLVLQVDAGAPQDADVQTLPGTGVPVRGTRVQIRGDDGREVPEGRPGLIHVGGVAATRAFCVADGELVDASADGWVPTGDVGAWIDGELYVIGRVKEIIKSAGRTYVPSDIEAALVAELGDDVTGAAVFGYYDEDAAAEQVVVVAEAARGLSSEAREALHGRVRLCVLQRFQLAVRDVVLVRPRAIPRTSSGKIQRVRLQQAYLAHTLGELVGA
ncbi:MAG TPA: AMP-binding protein [Longimicrobiaceae bacterium]|nr:AMP-binding protein [Longimicrobiaceae bacterium]